MAVHPQQYGSQIGQDWGARVEKPPVSVGLLGFCARALPLLLLGNALLLLISFWVAQRLLLGGAERLAAAVAPLLPALTAVLTLLFIGFPIVGAMLGFFDRRNWLDAARPTQLATRALRWTTALGAGLMLLLAVDASVTGKILLLQAFLFVGLSLAVAPLIGWGLARSAAHGSMAARRALIVGADIGARRIAGLLDWDERRQCDLVGLADTQIDGPLRGRRWPRFPLSDWDQLPDLAEALAVDEVILASGEMSRRAGAQIARRLAELEIETAVVPHLTGIFVAGAPVHWAGSVPLVWLGRPPRSRWGLLLKRAFDLGTAICALLLLLPLMLLVTLAVKLSSPGPIFYAQERVGQNGRRFPMYKFRSMVVSNDDTGHRRYVASLVKDGDAAGVDECGRPIYKIVDDPRITAIGRLLRRTSLDELPQLLNVIRGEMSLVGPRPPLPFEYDLYEPWQRLRLDATPGMTGLWQVSGRSYLSFEEMVLLDLYYASNWSFLLDLRLIWRTIPEVFCARGAR